MDFGRLTCVCPSMCHFAIVPVRNDVDGHCVGQTAGYPSERTAAIRSLQLRICPHPLMFLLPLPICHLSSATIFPGLAPGVRDIVSKRKKSVECEKRANQSESLSTHLISRGYSTTRRSHSVYADRDVQSVTIEGDQSPVVILRYKPVPCTPKQRWLSPVTCTEERS